MKIKQILLFIIAIIFAIEAFLLAVEPSNRYTFQQIFSKWNHSDCCSHYQEAQITRLLLVSFMVFGAISLISRQNIGFSLISQIAWMVFQTDTSNMHMKNVRMLGVQVLILVLIVENYIDNIPQKSKIPKSQLTSQSQSSISPQKKSNVEKNTPNQSQKNNNSSLISSTSSIDSPRKNKNKNKRN